MVNHNQAVKSDSVLGITMDYADANQCNRTDALRVYRDFLNLFAKYQRPYESIRLGIVARDAEELGYPLEYLLRLVHATSVGYEQSVVDRLFGDHDE